MKCGKAAGLALVLGLCLLAGCGRQGPVWQLTVGQDTLLADAGGREIWRGSGQAARNEFGCYLVTEFADGQPVQQLFSRQGELLASSLPGEQLLQLGPDWIARQKMGEYWRLPIDQEEYRFQSFYIQPDGSLLLCGLEGGGSLLLDADGAVAARFEQDVIWPLSEASGWYETPDGEHTALVDSQGQLRYHQVERMVGQGRALLQADGGYQVVELDTGKVLYTGTEAWRLYLDGLQVSMKGSGLRIPTPQGKESASYLDSWAWQGRTAYYLAAADGGSQYVWDAQGGLLFAAEAWDWMEPVEPGLFLQSDGDTIRMLDETGAELWRREGYQSVTFLDGEQTVLCCARGSVDSQEAAVRIQYDLLSLEGELLLEGLDAVYDAAPEGVAVRRGDTVGIADWKGNWKYFWADKDQ